MKPRIILGIISLMPTSYDFPTKLPATMRSPIQTMMMALMPRNTLSMIPQLRWVMPRSYVISAGVPIRTCSNHPIPMGPNADDSMEPLTG